MRSILLVAVPGSYWPWAAVKTITGLHLLCQRILGAARVELNIFRELSSRKSLTAKVAELPQTAQSNA
jgi:hypothetical protein